MKGGFFTEKYKSFPLGYEIEGKNDDERICYYKLQDGDVVKITISKADNNYETAKVDIKLGGSN